MDDDFFSEALDGKIEAVEFILQVVLERVAKETARSLLALGKFSHEDISQGTGLPLEVVEELAAQKTA